MNSNKILIVSSEFPPNPGGIGNHALNLATGLSNHNVKVSVLTNYRSVETKIENQFDANLGIEILRIRRHKFLGFTYLNRILAFRKLMRIEKPTIVIATGKFSLWLVAFGIRNATCEKIAVIHGSEVNLKVKWQHKLVDRALKHFKKVIAVSLYSKSLIANLNLKTVSVIPNGFDISNFENNNESIQLIGNPKLITVGAMSQRKGQHNVIKKLPALIKLFPRIHYHIVGTPNEQNKLMDLSLRLGVDRHVTFHGILDQKTLNNFLSECDIFVMLSEQTANGEVEGFGIAILEANFLGLPAIGSRNCGIEDAIKNHYSGILIDSNDEIAFLNAINEILKDKMSYSKNASEWSLTHTWENTVVDYLKLIDST